MARVGKVSPQEPMQRAVLNCKANIVPLILHPVTSIEKENKTQV